MTKHTSFIESLLGCDYVTYIKGVAEKHGFRAMGHMIDQSHNYGIQAFLIEDSIDSYRDTIDCFFGSF